MQGRELTAEETARIRREYAACFETPAGEFVLRDLFARFGGAAWHVTPPAIDTVLFSGGERNVVNFVLEALGRRSDPRQWSKVADDSATSAFFPIPE